MPKLREEPTSLCARCAMGEGMNTRRRFSCYAQANPCGAGTTARDHCREQLAGFRIRLVGTWIPRLLRALGLLHATSVLRAKSSLLPATSVLSPGRSGLPTGLLPAGSRGLPPGILPALRPPGSLLSAGSQGLRTGVQPALRSPGGLLSDRPAVRVRGPGVRASYRPAARVSGPRAGVGYRSGVWGRTLPLRYQGRTP